MVKELIRSRSNSIFAIVISIIIFIALYLILTPLIVALFTNSFRPAGALNLLASGIGTTVCLTISSALYLSMVSWKYAGYLFTKNPFDYIGCCGGVVVLFLAFQTCLIVMGIPVPDWEREYVGESIYSVTIALISSCVFAALWEEFIFRALLPSALSWLMARSNMVSIYLTPSARFVFSCFLIGVLFALLHEERTLAHTVYYILLSVWLGYWAARARALSVAVVGHSVAGLLSIISIYVFAV